jgi:hypothetical protein
MAVLDLEGFHGWVWFLEGILAGLCLVASRPEKAKTLERERMYTASYFRFWVFHVTTRTLINLGCGTQEQSRPGVP